MIHLDFRVIPDWFSRENHGAAVAVADLSGNGKPDVVVAMIDNPVGLNRGLYRLGKDLDVDGNVTGGWGAWRDIPDWFSWDNQGLGVVAEALARLHVIEPLAHVPKGFTDRWALVQLRALFTAGMPGDEQLHCRIRDLEDGQRAIYRRMDLGFQLAAKELSLAGLEPTPPTDSFAHARSRAAAELQAHLRDAWRRLGEPAKTVAANADQTTCMIRCTRPEPGSR